MSKIDRQVKHIRPRWHADRLVWLIWLGLVLVAVVILPFAIRNSEVVSQIAAMCGFTVT